MPNSIRNIAWTYRLLIVAIITIRSATAAVENPSPAQMQTGSLLMRMQHGYVAATVLNTDVNISINGLVARVSLMQEFKNEHSEWVEGVYVFPLPDKAAVDHMRLHIGDRIIEGEIQEKDKARKEYEQAKLAGKKTSLVEQQRANLFTTSVANIGPGETVIVEIEYLEDVRYDDGTFSLRFPMTLTPRFIPGQALPDRQGSGWAPDTSAVDDASLITPPMVSASAGHRVTLQATVNAGMPLEIIASRYHPVNVHEASGRYVVTFPDGQVPMDHDFELLWRPVPSSAPRAMAFSETINGEPHFLFMVMPPEAGAPVAAPVPREMIFIIDTSGSMHGVSIQQAKRALGRALDGLKTGDRFNVIEFNSYHHALFPTSVSADPSRIAAAKRFVRSLQANGGTNMQPALEFALQSAPAESYLRQIVFITDGAVGNEEGLYQLIEARPRPVAELLRSSARCMKLARKWIACSENLSSRKLQTFKCIGRAALSSILIRRLSPTSISASRLQSGRSRHIRLKNTTRFESVATQSAAAGQAISRWAATNRVRASGRCGRAHA